MTPSTPKLRLAAPAFKSRSTVKGWMERPMIPVEESFAEWRKEADYREAYDALDREFALASALVEADGRRSTRLSTSPTNSKQ